MGKKQFKKNKEKQGKQGFDKKQGQGKGGNNFTPKEDKEGGNLKFNETKAANDPLWYAKFPNLANNAGKLSFADVMGKVWPSAQGVPQARRHSFAGICTIEYAPTIGYVENPKDPINVITGAIYKTIQDQIGYNIPYQSADVMMVLLAIKEVWALYHAGCRVLTETAMADVGNNFVYNDLITASGFDATDIRNNRIAMYDYLLQVSNVLNLYEVPDDMTIYDRDAQLLSFIFRDTDSSKSSFYVFKRAGYFKYESTQSETGGGLTYSSLDDSLMTYDQFKSRMDSMINSILFDDDVKRILGDVKGMCEKNGLKLKSVAAPRLFAADESKLAMDIICYDEAMLWQIHNATFYGEAGLVDNNITQDVGIIKSNPRLGTSAIATQVIHLLDSPSHSPEPLEIIELSRLSPDLQTTYKTCGVEIPLWMHLYYYDQNNTLQSVKFSNFSCPGDNTAQTATVTFEQLLTLELISNLDFHPAVYVKTPSNSSPIGFHRFADATNVAILTAEQASIINRCCAWSMFYIDKLGVDIREG